ncbi:MAG TPA: hypothetical protein DHN29_15475 [Cytophagales bacterium]|nr:hypothetical protein [Cytophagales bacterium]
MKGLLSLCFLLTVLTVNAQDLSTYQWQNRLLVILSYQENNPMIKKQLRELTSQQQALEERRLLTVVMTPEKYKLASEGKKWVAGSNYSSYQSGKVFEVLLIGLDGSIKQRESGIFTVGKLISIIDSMPMRQAEIRGY